MMKSDDFFLNSSCGRVALLKFCENLLLLEYLVQQMAADCQADTDWKFAAPCYLFTTDRRASFGRSAGAEA